MTAALQTPNELNHRKLEFPEWSDFLFRPARYKVPYGGRGSTKSWTVARALLWYAAKGYERILCARELQNSISESVHRLLQDQITLMGMDDLFIVQQNSIYCPSTQSEFFFYGIKSNPTKVKSAEGITKVWVEEAEKVSDNSWQILIPTIRKPGSEIWVTFNPDEEKDPTYQRFVLNPPPGAQIRKVNWTENPWFPDVLRDEKDYLASVDADAYTHVWEGECRKNSTSQIFRGKYVVQDFVPPTPDLSTKENPMWDGPYFGVDWGFSNDPTAATKSWIDNNYWDSAGKKGRRLMVEYEAWALHCELDDTPTLLKVIPGALDHLFRADNSRPETISHVAHKPFCENLKCDFTFNTSHPEPKCPKCGGKHRNLRVEAAEKWSGSVEDGIAFLRSFSQIVLHSRCKHVLEEMRLYSYKVDRLTGDVLTDIVSKHDHTIDSARYAMQPLIMNTTSLGVWSRL